MKNIKIKFKKYSFLTDCWRGGINTDTLTDRVRGHFYKKYENKAQVMWIVGGEI
jgi:hypothetical protein